MYGVGISLLYFPILAVAPEYFDAHRGSAMGLHSVSGRPWRPMLCSGHSLTTLQDGHSMDVACIRHYKLRHCRTDRLDHAIVSKSGPAAYVGQPQYRQKVGIHITSDSSYVPSGRKSRATELSTRIFYTPRIHCRLWRSIVGHQ
jgi:hypothetical protein